jgi:hypothetical protein
VSDDRPDDLFEGELLDGRPIVVRAREVAAISPAPGRDDASVLLVGGKEFTILGAVGDVAQELLAD